MSKEQKGKREQRFVETCLRRLEKNQQEANNPTESKSKDWYDFYARTDEVLVPSKWVRRLEEATALNNELQFIREKLEEEQPEATPKVDREALYCSSALHKIRQNAFHQRLSEHQARWQPVLLVGELAASLPKATTDPAEIERQLSSDTPPTRPVTMLRRPLTKIDIKVDEIEDLNAAIQERKNQKPGMAGRDPLGAPILPPPSQSVFTFPDTVGTSATPR